MKNINDIRKSIINSEFKIIITDKFINIINFNKILSINDFNIILFSNDDKIIITYKKGNVIKLLDNEILIEAKIKDIKYEQKLFNN